MLQMCQVGFASLLMAKYVSVTNAHLLVDLVSKHAELKALELHHQDSWRFVDGHALGCPHFLLLLWAYVLVCSVQILTGGEALQSLLYRTGLVYLQAEIQKDVICVGLMPALCTFHLQVVAAMFNGGLESTCESCYQKSQASDSTTCTWKSRYG